jgi:non-haem Fe2+, alpha-ketoglutarate-dependent halogenase
MTSPKVLTPAQVRQFNDEGFLSPIPILSTGEAAGYRARLEAFERSQGSPLKGGQRNKAYLLFTWAYEIMTHPSLLDAVEDLIGPDLVVYHSTAWIKEARSPGFVSWHQDSTYFGLEPLEEVTAWVALSPATTKSGCVRVLPGSHKLGQLPADMRPDQNNLLTSGQTVKFSVDDASTVEMPLAPGEVSLHQACTIHGSAGNDSDDRRIGLCLHYVPAHVRPNAHLIKSGALCSALRVRGAKKHDLFPAEPAPLADNDKAAIAAHAAAVASYRNMVQALGHMTAGRLDS